MIKVAIITVSDRSAHGERKDLSGNTIREMLGEIEAEVVWYKIVPDELEVIKSTLKEAIEKWEADLVLTTGGTGLAVRDVTPEATREVVEKIVPGICEAMRLESFKKTPRAILSRAIAGTRGRSLIINLPGSPRGVRESLAVILKALPHGIAILKGEATD